jgi:hydroxypyruvate reductase
MSDIAAKLRADAERIWRAGVAAVLPERLVPENVQVDGKWLAVGDDVLDLDSIERIVVVGAGKAAGGMAVAFEHALGLQLLDEKHVGGWVNVPADCVVPTQRIHLHAARAAGVNEPSIAGVEGTRRIFEIVSSLGPDDVCFCLLTGGGSALLPAPVPEISLEEKVRVTRLLSGAGANIEQLNIVRQNLSLVKGGGLARACRAGRLITLIISDVLGDPLDLIGSGPTVQRKSTPTDALDVLESLQLTHEPSIAGVVNYLRGSSQQSSRQGVRESAGPTTVTNLLIGNNATAVDGAGVQAEKLGYSHAMIAATKSEGPAEDVGRHLAKMALHMRDNGGPDCLISGGEPTVKLVDEQVRGKGGRNQQLALAALAELGDCHSICLMSGGTDGEDGPTNAAGAFVDEEIVRAAATARLDPKDYLSRNDAYTFFQKCGGLSITGPTQTNVCDLRVICCAR